MQMVKIQMANDDRARGFVELARRGRVDCYRDDVFVVPEPALALLNALGVTSRELDRGSIGWANGIWTALMGTPHPSLARPDPLP